MILFWTFQKGAFFLSSFLGLALLMGFGGGRLPGLTGLIGLIGLTGLTGLPGNFPGVLTTWTEILDIFKKKKKTRKTYYQSEVV